MPVELDYDASYFRELQTATGWGQILASFARWCAPQPGEKTLDVGCGPGLLPALFTEQGAAAIGIDLDLGMFTEPLHPHLAAANGISLPFQADTFQTVTAANMLYLSADPLAILADMARVTTGTVCLLNPSEHMSIAVAKALADERQLTGLARDTLINYAQRAEDFYRWSEADLSDLFSQTGLTLTQSTLRMGSGLVRYARGKKFGVS